MIELLTLGRVRLATGADGGAAAASPQPKRTAVLTYLVLAPGGGPVRRDALLALFWPELGDEEARRALRQALHYLRRVAGDVFTAEGDEVGLRAGAVWCDALELERRIEAGRPSDAVDLYRGDFLAGFHVEDAAPEYEEWVDRMRARCRRRAAAAAQAASEEAERSGDGARAVELARRACEIEPDQEAAWRRVMTLHARLADRAGALRAYDELAQRLARDFDAEPAAETAALAESIRRTPLPETGAHAPIVALASAGAPEMPGRAAPDDAAAALPTTPPAGAAAGPAARASTRYHPALGVLAAVGVLLLGWLALRGVMQAEAPDSLIRAGALARRDRIIVADFADRTGDTLLTAAVTEAFRVDLGQSAVVRVLTPRQVAVTLERMKRPADVALVDSVAREVAVREGVKAIVTGSVARLGAAYTIGVQLVSAERGEALAAVRETARDSTELIEAVGRASRRLRRRVGESLRELRAVPPLADATTGSLPALRKYTQARVLFRAGRRAEAIQLYEQAIALDTGFASAYTGLGLAYGSIAERGRSMAALRRAVERRRRLPLLEGIFAVATYALDRGDVETALDAYSRALARYPDEVRVLNNLALIYQYRREFAKAESLFTRAAVVDSTIANLYFGIHGEQVLQGKFAESRRTLDLIARRFPGHPILMNVEIQDAAAQQSWEAAERRAEVAIGANQGDTLALVDPFEALAGIVMTQGRLAEAERHWRTQLALSAAAGSRGRHLFGLVQLAKLYLRHRGSAARALALVDSALAAMPLDSILPADRNYDELARFYAAAGRPQRAKELVAAAAANDRVLDRAPGPERRWTLGVIALAEGRLAEAEEALRDVAETLPCTVCALPDLARAYEARGRRRPAIVVYERYLATPWLWRYEVDASELGWSMRRLAELHDADGEAATAAAVRRRLLQLWQRADPELQGVVTEARQRLASVGG